MTFAVSLAGQVHGLRFENLDELRIARDRLREARFGGVRTTRFGEDEVTFKSDAEMASALAAIEAEIVRQTRGERPRTFYPRTSKGL